MKLVRDTSIHLNLIQRAKLLTDDEKQRLLADVQENGITEENEPAILEAYQAEMRRIDEGIDQCNELIRMIGGEVHRIAEEQCQHADQGQPVNENGQSPPEPEGLFGRLWRFFTPRPMRDRYGAARGLIEWEVEHLIREQCHQPADVDAEQFAAKVCSIIDDALTEAEIITYADWP